MGFENLPWKSIKEFKNVYQYKAGTDAYFAYSSESPIFKLDFNPAGQDNLNAFTLQFDLVKNFDSKDWQKVTNLQKVNYLLLPIGTGPDDLALFWMHYIEDVPEIKLVLIKPKLQDTLKVIDLTQQKKG